MKFMEPNIELPALLAALVLCNGLSVYAFRRQLAKRTDLKPHSRRVWTYLLAGQALINLIALGVTGYLPQWLGYVLPN